MNLKIGLLWRDADLNDSIDVKVARAVTYYEQKYFKKPNVCYVHPSAIEEETTLNGVEIKKSRSVMRNHFWLGVA